MAKPDPLIFRTAAERAGVTLEGAWMVGDNLDADIAGAHGVGARSVWVKRDWDWMTYRSGTEPDLVADVVRGRRTPAARGDRLSRPPGGATRRARG